MIEKSKDLIYLSLIELYNGYFKSPFDGRCNEITTFTNKIGTFKLNLMRVGLMHALETGQRLLNEFF